MRTESGLAVPMRDGVSLCADAYLPDGDEPVPVILSRTPYDRSFRLTPVAALDPERATEAGFALVVQDVRGLGGSGGEFRPFDSETPDGCDTIEWLAAQPWCDGNVGMAGRSYPAGAQWRAAVGRPEHLRAINPVVAGNDLYLNWLYRGGAFELGFNLFWVHLMTNPRARGSLDEHYRHLPLTDPPLLADNPAADFYREWLAHPTYDEHWKAMSLRGRYGDVQVPALNVAGWFDVFLSGTLENFVGVRESGGSERARAGTRLIVGPWAHGNAYGGWPDHAFKEFERMDAIDLTEIGIDFFARHLRGGEPDEDEAPVRMFVMGANRWRDEPEWPLARARTERWFLRAEGRLAPEPPAGEGHDEYVYDPRDPAPTIGGPTSMPAKFMRQNAGPLDQSPLDKRDDVLIYSSPPLERPLEVTGPLELVLFAATSAPDTDWVAKLCDVNPEGKALILAEGVIRARYREGFEEPRPIEPERVLEYRLDLVATSNVFRPGHRIRLYVTSSSFPRFDRNANTGNPIGADTEEDMRAATQRIFHDADHASHLLLPVVD